MKNLTKVSIGGTSLKVGDECYWFVPSYKAIISRRVLRIMKTELGTLEVWTQTKADGGGFNNVIKLQITKTGVMWNMRYGIGKWPNRLFTKYDSCRRYICGAFSADMLRPISPYKCGVDVGKTDLL